MSIFFDPSSLYPKIRILILGSYHPDNMYVLDDLVQYLKNKGFEQTSLANELIELPEYLSAEEINSYILTEIEEIMEKFDFNIFILFPEHNNSVIVELSSYINSELYNIKREKSVVLLPFEYGYAMVEGLIFKKKIKTFRYNNEVEIKQYCYTFIKTNLKI